MALMDRVKESGTNLQWAIASYITGRHWARIVMHQKTRELVTHLDPSELDALEISGQEWERLQAFRTYRSVHYPDFDICNDTLDDQFNLILAEQVWEHLPYPYRAARNVHTMLKPDGYFLVTTPFLIKIHGEAFGDYSRWTETGMLYFLHEAGFDLDHITTGSWGNRACAKANFNRWAWKWPWRSLKNEPDFPVVVWALAQK